MREIDKIEVDGSFWIHIGRYGIVKPGMYGNVFSSEEEMNASHEYFYRVGGYRPDCVFFNLRPCVSLEKPPAPYFTEASNVAIAHWYFGMVRLAPERPGNNPYQHIGELYKEALGKFVWVEDFESGLEFFCQVLYDYNTTINCSLYYPYSFDYDNYALTTNFYGKFSRHPWVARARPKNS